MSARRALLSLICVGAMPAAAQAPAGPFDYSVLDVAPGVFTFSEKRLNPMVTSNITAVVGSRSVLIYDAGYHPSITREIADSIRRRAGKPVSHIVISHWHDDHWAATHDLSAAFPTAQVIAHPVTARLILSRRDSFAGPICRDGILKFAEPYREMIRTGKRADGSAISEASMTRMRNFVEASEAHAVQCGEMKFRTIDRTVAGSEMVDLGGRRVEIKFLGRGNTAGDLVVAVPDAGVVMTGDLLVHPFPFMTQPYITEWAVVLRKIEALHPRRIVPGHGPVFEDLTYLRDMIELLDAIASQGRKAWKPGMTADELKKAIDLSALAQRFSKGDAFIRANFDAQASQAVDRMWQELSGNWKPEGV